MLNETFLKNNHKLLFLNVYKVYRNDRITAAGGGVVIAVRKSIKHSLLPEYAEYRTNGIENISISTFINRWMVILTAAYRQNRCCYADFD